MINLNEFKNKKKYELILSDLTNIVNNITSSIESLKDYNKYISVCEIISVLHTNRTILEIQINKYKRLLNESK